MPGLLNPPASSACSPLAVSSNAIWSKRRDEITFDQLQKFWNELPPHARQELLRIDKQTLFEQARKNLYCSRCNGLLLEGFSQIVMYGKSLQQEGSGFHLPNRTGVASKTYIDNEIDDAKDPSVHPWGGLAATRDGLLTLLDCFINARSLKALQNVFDSARARERERELLYPDACGGGGRGWISQGMTNYGRGHGTRETCALHTARLSCDTLVDFWSALSEETRTSLLRMKEEDFMERLMYRFDSKRFCRDCRRNVIREFKELKELKRMRRELCCTSWFCVADTDFQYEVSEDTIQADWHQTFADTAYNRFEWAIGTAEGKYDILEYEDVGMNLQVQMNGLDLGGLSACYISLRAFKSDGRCTELCVKAHALKGQPCVHRRLIIGDGSVMITKGESIRRFFEHAEEAEEEEDEDGIDRDGNEFDGDGSRPQKHAKSPELAREFLLDAATVIFKEQVEKAFREGTARQNAHSIFVSLALKLLEERVHVACKEIITLEKQIKLLEEEEKEKREEEERRERRKVKEREKKLRRKERLKGKERERERKNNSELDSLHVALSTSANDLPSSTHEVSSPTTVDSGDSISDPGDVITPERPISPDIKDEQYDTNSLKNDDIRHQCHVDEDFIMRDNNGSFTLEQSKSSRRKLRLKKDSLLGQASKWYEGSAHHDKFSNTRLMAPSWMNGGHKPLRERVVKVNPRNCNPKYSEKYQCSSSRMRDRYDFQSCSCSQTGDHRPKDGYHISTLRSVREIKTANKQEPAFYRGNKYSHGCFIQDNCALPKGKLSAIPRQVWEPLDARRKNNRLNSDSDPNSGAAVDNNQFEEINNSGISENLSKTDTQNTSCSEFVAVTKSDCYSEDGALGNSCGDPIISSSSSDNCSPCISEGDSNTSSSGTQITDSSSTSDSEDTPPRSEEREDSCFTMKATEFEPTFFSPNTDNGAGFGYNLPPQRPCMPPMNNHSMHIPVFSSPGIGYQNPNPVSWQPSGPSGLMTFPQSNHFVCSPSPFNYSLPPPRSSSEFGMHYDPLQTVTTPLFTPRYHSFYQANNRVYVPKPKEQINNFGVAAPIVSVSPAKTQFRERQITSKPPSDEPSKPFDDNPCFSLFHFGGPVAGAAGFNVNSDSLKEDTSGRLAPKSAGSLQADSTCSKEDTTIEEYSLFKTGNGARFSFF